MPTGEKQEPAFTADELAEMELDFPQLAMIARRLQALEEEPRWLMALRRAPNGKTLLAAGGLAAICAGWLFFAWTTYPWTKAQCERWASNGHSDLAVNLRYSICLREFGKAGANR